MKNNSYIRLFILLLLIIISVILITMSILNWSTTTTILEKVKSIFMPFVWGGVFAYLFTPLINFLEKTFNFKRWQSILITILITVLVVILLIRFIFPAVVVSIVAVFEGMPGYVKDANKYLSDLYNFLDKNEGFKGIIQITGYETFDELYLKMIEPSISKAFTKLGTYTMTFFESILMHVVSFTNSTIKFVFGFLISLYLMYDKEKLIFQMKQTTKVIFGEVRSKGICETAHESNKIFRNYLVGKTIDSLIIGLLTFIIMFILKTPYPLLFGVIVGVLNMIPYFGPLLGMIPTTIITLFVDPKKAFWVLIAIIVIQQFDGWILGPKILGDSLDISALWIIFAVIIGGGFFGFLGMLLGVPILAIIRYLLIKLFNKKGYSLEYQNTNKK